MLHAVSLLHMILPRWQAVLPTSRPQTLACTVRMQGALAQPDFDMWQSKHLVAGLHAAARAVSGG